MLRRATLLLGVAVLAACAASDNQTTTGFRRSELLGHMVKAWRGEREGLRWKDVDLEGGLVNLHDSKAGPQTRVLGSAAVDLLRAAKPPTAAQDEPVCPGKIPGQPFVGIDRPRRRVYLAAGLADVDLHSLRHSYVSIGAHLQGGRFAGHGGPLIGHGFTSRSITERYITADPEGLRPAADAISEAVAGHLGLGQPGRLVDFPAKRA